jgi:hypothetical protein
MPMPRIRAHLLIAAIWIAGAVALLVLAIWAAFGPPPADGLFWIILLWGTIGFFMQRDFRIHRDHSSTSDYGLATYLRDKWDEPLWRDR